MKFGFKGKVMAAFSAELKFFCLNNFMRTSFILAIVDKLKFTPQLFLSSILEYLRKASQQNFTRISEVKKNIYFIY